MTGQRDPFFELFDDALVREVASDPVMRAVLVLHYAGAPPALIAEVARCGRPRRLPWRLLLVGALLAAAIACTTGLGLAVAVEAVAEAGVDDAIGGQRGRYGHRHVPFPETRAVPLSGKLLSMRGYMHAGRDGFSVTLDGVLSLEGVRLFGAEHPLVERASILNRGDHCVLTVVFVEGHSPAFSVDAEDGMLRIRIEGSQTADDGARAGSFSG